jgi:Mrp family chromosome partitioning ATPase
MLESRRGQRLTEQLAERADLVIFDCPPLTAGADAAAVAALARNVLFVIDLRLSTRRRLRECLRKLETVNTRVAGCVVNRDRTLRPVDYGYRYLPARAPEVKEEPRVEHSA